MKGWRADRAATERGRSFSPDYRAARLRPMDYVGFDQKEKKKEKDSKSNGRETNKSLCQQQRLFPSGFPSLLLLHLLCCFFYSSSPKGEGYRTCAHSRCHGRRCVDTVSTEASEDVSIACTRVTRCQIFKCLTEMLERKMNCAWKMIWYIGHIVLYCIYWRLHQHQYWVSVAIPGLITVVLVKYEPIAQRPYSGGCHSMSFYDVSCP